MTVARLLNNLTRCALGKRNIVQPRGQSASVILLASQVLRDSLALLIEVDQTFKRHGYLNSGDNAT